MCPMDQIPAMTSRSVPVKTRNRLRAHHSMIRLTTSHCSRSIDCELLAGNYGLVLAGGDCDLPCSPGTEIAFAFVHAATFFGEIHAGFHGGHPHGRHGRHEEGDVYLRSADGRSIGSGQLYPKNVATLARRSWIGD